MATLDELLERERLKNAPPSPGMQKAIEETAAEIRAAFDRSHDPAPPLRSTVRRPIVADWETASTTARGRDA